jgi:agmatinase
LFTAPFTFGRRELSLKEARYAVIGIPYDSSQSYRSGSRHAPAAIREASREIEDYDILSDFNLHDLKICDLGDIDVSFGYFEETARVIEDTIRDILKHDVIPVSLGGEHTISYGVIRAFDKKPFYVVLDAHLDFRDEYLNNRFSHACVLRRIGELVGFKNMLAIGVRSGSLEEINGAKEAGLNFIDFNECENSDSVLDKISGIVSDKNVYLSIDMDVLDPVEARGVGKPEPLGFSYRELLGYLRALSSSSRLIGVDLVEICPQYDSYTPILGAKLIFKVLEAFERQSQLSLGKK